MAGAMADVGACCSCLVETKYICLKCGEFVCICAVFEDDEETVGWKAGRCVAHCDTCYREKMESDTFSQEIDRNISVSRPSSRSSVRSESCQSTTNKPVERVEDSELEDNDLDNRSHDGDNDMEGEDVPVQSKGKKKKSGRKSSWSSEDVDDFVDIVVSNSYYKRKLIFTNTKCQRNGEIYDEILTELKKRASVRGKKFKFAVKQLRTKFLKCVSDCKQAALTIKTATGIKRFQEDRGLGNWFKTLFAVVKTRDSCQPDQALEPSCLEQSCSSEKSPYSETLADPEMSSDLERNNEGRLFVPIKKSKKGKTKDKLEAAAMEAVGLVKEIVSNDSTKDLINFLREEMHQSREHELKLLQLLSKPNVDSDARQQQHPFQAMPHFGNTQYVEGGPMVANYNQQWDGTFVPNISSQPAGLPRDI